MQQSKIKQIRLWKKTIETKGSLKTILSGVQKDLEMRY